MTSQKLSEALSTDLSSSSLVATKELSRWYLELPKIPEKYHFNGFSLLQWKEYVEMILLDNKILQHLTRAGPFSSDPSYQNWRETDAVIKAWLLDTMELPMSEYFVRIPTVQLMWEKAQKTRFEKYNEHRYVTWF